jgi:cobalamin biosynthesis Mg chelatase CobN
MQQASPSKKVRFAFIGGPVVLALVLFLGIQVLGSHAGALGMQAQATASPSAASSAATAAAPAASAGATAAAPAATSAAAGTTTKGPGVATPAAGLPATGTGGLLDQHSSGTSMLPWLPILALVILAGGFISYRLLRQN